MEMVLLVVSAILTVLVCTVSSDSCPSKYTKLSPNHSFCLHPNPDCKVISKGIEDKSEIVEILDAHNTNRSKVATGKEKGGHGLPPAANMMELTWDQELADIAQKWAEQCKFGHDCGKCRSTPNEYAGQNIALMMYYCPDGKCGKKKPNWKGVVEMWYSEVDNFDRSMIPHINIMNGKGGKMIGHFTQVTWAETKTVGCGYVSYPEGGWGKQFFVCNYGPGGNMSNAPLYKVGAPCSQCPAKTCCGDTCKTGKIYPGLCRATN